MSLVSVQDTMEKSPQILESDIRATLREANTETLLKISLAPINDAEKQWRTDYALSNLHRALDAVSSVMADRTHRLKHKSL